MSHVFISYVHENERTVAKLYRELTTRGIRVWVDRNDIAPGTLWQDAIRNAICQGDFFVACFSKEYNQREQTYMNEELTLAIEELRKRPKERAWFIPVRLSGQVPDWGIGSGKTLRSIQWVELTKTRWDDGLQRILSVISPQKMLSASSGKLIPIPKRKSSNPRISFIEADGSIDIPANLLPKNTNGLLALTVKGNSFKDSFLNDGDVVVLRKQETAKNGELVAVWLKRQRRNMLCRLYRVKNKFQLQRIDPTYSTIIEHPNNVEVRAKVVVIERRLAGLA